MRGVGGECEMFMCLTRGVVGGEWKRGLGLGFINPVGTEKVWNVLFRFRWSGYGRVGCCYVSV